MRVVVTEKPSVARDLARVLDARDSRKGFIGGHDLRLTWCFGHMAELDEPAAYEPAWRQWDAALLPMLPEVFKLRVREGAKEQFDVISGLLCGAGVTEVINACDAGREGELIFRFVYELSGCRVPVRRLWVSSMTDQALRTAWAQLERGERYDALADAARCRSEADWLVGLNATRAMTCLARSGGGNQLMSVGRVQTPTLAMIVGRDIEIEDFVPEDFWQVKASFVTLDDAGTEPPTPFEATWFRTDVAESGTKKAHADSRDSAQRTRLGSAAAASSVAEAARGQDGEVVEARHKEKLEKPPLLYDLTSLQRRANQRLGFSADRTLKIAQALYERHKLITYPRTDARYLTPDQVDELPAIVRAVGEVGPYASAAEIVLRRDLNDPGKRIVDASEVGDHHAILPTTRVATRARLSVDEKRVYDLIARRFLAALSPDARFATSHMVISIQPNQAVHLPSEVTSPLLWQAKGRVRLEAGWQQIDPPARSRDTDLPRLDAGQMLRVADVAPVPGQTKPPKPHNDASILKKMETAGRELDDAEAKRAMRQSGLGTPATRAAILNTLLKRGFIERDKRHLRATERGRALVAAVPVEELKSAELTGAWEARLARVAEGAETRTGFMEAVRTRTTELVAAILNAEPPPPSVVADDRPVFGECPVCGRPVREGRGAWSCDAGRACTFVIFKKFARRTISKRSAMQLLKDGRTPVLKNFKSKKGKIFEAALKLDDDGRMCFDFPKRTRSSEPPASAARSPELPAVGQACPECAEGRVIRGRTAWGCSRWREGCQWRHRFPSE